MDYIKDSGLILSVEIEQNVRTIVIKKINAGHQTYLEEVLTAIPPGLVNKTETGMGATTLELLTPRNSIIVEPIKITASSKAASRPGCFYVGGVTRYHPERISLGKIINYLLDKSIPYKKIVVVADSLWKVMKAIESVSSHEFSKLDPFFLLIDEVDSFQLDSSFRKSMEECIDVYKKFDPQNRALLSATVMNFTDPDLDNEPVTVLQYDDKVIRDINLIISHKLKIQGTVVNKVIDLLRECPDDKILVAYNSVTRSFNIAQELIVNHGLSPSDIGILCSQSSKDIVGVFFKELDSAELPAKVNFCTSAYFTGFDLYERYHLVTVTSVFSKVHALSEKRIKQIAGRARNGLLSETIIQDFETDENKRNQEIIDAKKCLESAETELKVLRCIQRQFSENSILKDNYHRISNLILDTLEYEGKRFLRSTNTENPQISYFNIDAAIENSYVLHHLYQEPLTLQHTLVSEGHNVTLSHDANYRDIQSANVERVNRINRINEMISILEGISSLQELIALESRKSQFNPIQIKIYDFFRRMNGFVNSEDLINNLKVVATKKDSRMLNNFILSMNFLIDAPGELFKSRVLRYLKLGVDYKPDQLAEAWKIVFTEVNIRERSITKINAVRLTKVLFKVRKSRTTGLFTILALNPYRVRIIKTRSEIEDAAISRNLLSSVVTS